MIAILEKDEIEHVVGGMDGLGPDTPAPDFEYECPNLAAYRRMRELNPL